MNRRTFTTMALLGLAVATALPQAGLAQSHPLIGTWKVNLAKSKYSPGPPPRSNTAIWEAVGQGFRTRTEGIDAQGNPTKTDAGVFSFDGKSYPYTGNAAYDASSYKQIGITEKVMRAPHLSQMLPSPAMKSRRRLKGSCGHYSCLAYERKGV